MHLHILGISGTFMSALAILAKELGYKVTGNDTNCYPPVSTLLAQSDITYIEGYDEVDTALKSDLIVVGNFMRRAMPIVEAVLNADKPYISGPDWVWQEILATRRVIAVAGTHGKTTTTSMIAWILEYAGLNPGFLIGGVASNFNTSARLGSGSWFVIEADEYDTAFFDKRPKFMHYRPEIVVLNNLEFDHADIYADLAAIKLQFTYLLRTVPGKGKVIAPSRDKNLAEVLASADYLDVELTGVGTASQGHFQAIVDAENNFVILQQGIEVAQVKWSLLGHFNVENALASFAASIHAGVTPEVAARALEAFVPVKRRLEVVYDHNGITIYDDFAHHPTAIANTIQALQANKRHERVLAVIELGSYTMRAGVHGDKVLEAAANADAAYLFAYDDKFNVEGIPQNIHIFRDFSELFAALQANIKLGDAVLVMSNRGFNGIHDKLKAELAS
jgi:UDP-N-acetylmuramate: L-alanyl-gamma-D-glutamyl-meso-diaminopimelate ligase